MPAIPPVTDYLTAHAIHNFTEYYVIFATLGLLIHLLRFFFYNYLKSDNHQEEVSDLKEQIENLNNVLEAVIKHVTRDQTNYDEEKAEFVEETKDEKEETTPVKTNDTKED